MKNKFLYLFFVLQLVISPFFGVASIEAAPNINATNKWAWSENSGWVNFNPAGGSVEVTDTAINGHIWIPNYGWVNLQPLGGGVTNDTSGNVGGYAWGENTGYINFSGVTINSSGEFIGYATNSVTGQISMNCSNTSSCGSSDFKVQTTWLPSAGGGGGSTKQRRQSDTSSPSEVVEPLLIPSGLVSKSIDSQSIRLDWVVDSDVQDGFRIYGKEGDLLAEITDPNTRTYVLANLDANTLYGGLSISSFNTAGESAKSIAFPDAITLLPDVLALMIDRTTDTATFSIDPLVELTLGQTAIQFEVIVNSETVLTSNWQTNPTWLIDTIQFSDTLQVRVRTRNQAGDVSAWSEATTYEGIQEIPADLSIGLNLSTVSGSPVTDGIRTNEILQGVITITNTSDVIAENVLVTLGLPTYLLPVSNSLFVNGLNQTDGIDSDLAQNSSGALSAVWATQEPGQTISMSFQLQFAQDQLRAFKQSASAAVTLGPSLSLQAIVSASNLPVSRVSNGYSFAPDLDSLDIAPDPVVPEPVVPPIPTPVTPVTPPVQQPSISNTDSGQKENDESVPGVPNDSSLLLTGNVQTENDQIRFSGTTSQPNSQITVVFNHRVTRTLLSDENGVWTTFVSAQELGIRQGEVADVLIEAEAVNSDRTSNRIVQSVSISLASEKELFVLDTPIVSFDVIEDVVIDLKDETAVALTVSAPLIVLATPTLWGYLPYIPNLLYHFATWFIGLFRKKKNEHLYGIVYDSITKEPLPLAIVRIYSQTSQTNRLIATVVTDKAGRYEALLQPGSYKLQVVKPTYSFPSTVVTSQFDGNYQNISQGNFELADAVMSLPDLPVDPENKPKRWSAANSLKKAWIIFRDAGTHLAVPVLLVGSITSMISLYFFPSELMYYILSMGYILMLALHLRLRAHPVKQWGIVYDLATGASLPLVTLQLIDPEFGKVVKSRLSDYQGRFAFLPEPGQYVIRANKEGYTQPEVVEQSGDLKPIQGKIEIKKEGQVIDGDVALKAS